MEKDEKANASKSPIHLALTMASLEQIQQDGTKNMIIADTGFWVALIDPKDSYHAAADRALQKYNEPLITTWPVMTETCYLLLRNKGASVASSFIQSTNASERI